MSVILANNLTLDTSVLAQFGPDSPLIGWHNVLTSGNAVATYQDAAFPASNVANASTYLRWKSTSVTAPQHLRFNGLVPGQIDYVAIAGHNFGSALMPVTLQGFAVDISPAAWIELVQMTTPPDDAPLIFRFPAQQVNAIRLQFGSGITSPPNLSTPPQAAVAYVGQILLLERKLWIDHTPITYGRTAKIANGRSENGNFLGRIVLNERNETNVNVLHISPTHYRSDIDPFIEASKEVPFFFSWRPTTYPNEVGYAWMMNEPHVTHVSPHGLMQLELQMQGLA
jgi:hypothetical protein